MEHSITQVERVVSEADLKAIEDVRNAHVSAINAGDVTAFVALFAEDGVQMPPNAPVNLGRTMIRSWAQGFFSRFGCRFALAVREVRIVGDWAFEWGDYTITLDPVSGGPSIMDKEKYLAVSQREAGGSWLLARDIWNSSEPPRGM